MYVAMAGPESRESTAGQARQEGEHMLAEPLQPQRERPARRLQRAVQALCSTQHAAASELSLGGRVSAQQNCTAHLLLAWPQPRRVLQRVRQQGRCCLLRGRRARPLSGRGRSRHGE